MRFPYFPWFRLKYFFLLTASLFHILVYLVCALVISVSHDLPAIPATDDAGALRAAFGTAGFFEPVPYAAIPEPVVHAFLAADDVRYLEEGYSQPGCFYWIRTLFRSGTTLYCGMSYSDQLSRVLVQAENRDRHNPLRRCALDYKLRLFLSKTEILGLYLNTVYLGNSRYGVQAAARLYFCKTLDELTPSEAACLAVLAHGPSRFNPFTRPAELQHRRDWLLDRMAAHAFLSAGEAEAAKAVPVRGIICNGGSGAEAP